MGRKRVDKEKTAAAARLDAALNHPQFKQAWADFHTRWKARGYPLIFEDYEKHLDTQKGGIVYSGTLYELRDLCDGFKLLWPDDGFHLVRMAWNEFVVPNLRAPLIDEDPPTAQEWQYFRQAREGLGVLRPDELQHAPKLTNSGRRRDLREGLPYDAIAEMADVTERTVQPAVERCWEYLRTASLERVLEIATTVGLKQSAWAFLAARTYHDVWGKAWPENWHDFIGRIPHEE
jgi:hypothetical protein